MSATNKREKPYRSSTPQPQWQIVANLGDETPLDHGGLFVLVDKTGVYTPEVENLDVIDDGGPPRWIVNRIILEQCTFIDGVLSDNKFHPDSSVWFSDDLDAVASYIGAESKQVLIDQLCSADPIERAHAYRAMADYHGYYNFSGDGDLYTSKFELMNHYRQLQRKG